MSNMASSKSLLIVLAIACTSSAFQTYTVRQADGEVIPAKHPHSEDAEAPHGSTDYEKEETNFDEKRFESLAKTLSREDHDEWDENWDAYLDMYMDSFLDVSTDFESAYDYKKGYHDSIIKSAESAKADSDTPKADEEVSFLETSTEKYGKYRGGWSDYYAEGWIDASELVNSGQYFDFSEVKLYNSRSRKSHEAHVDWSCDVAHVQWEDLCEGIVFFEVDHESMLIMNFNGHTHSEAGSANSWLYLSFWIDDVEHPMPGAADWGQYHIYREINEVLWAPCSWVQQYRVGRGKHEVVVKGRVNYGHMKVNGWAFQVGVIPR